MPFVVYIFAVSAFALGLAEFVPIGLTTVMAAGLNVGIETAGLAVTAYALGAVIAAPVLTALTANWTRKGVMLVAAFVFTVGALVVPVTENVTLILVARFAAGMGHGLFMAAASSTAARLAGPRKAGSAVAVVFGGFTLALAVGVPFSVYLSETVSWQLILGAIGVFGAIGFFGLLIGMRDPLPATSLTKKSAMSNLAVLFHGKLLFGALVTVFAYAGSFAAYTYITPLLSEITGVEATSISTFMLVYGVMAAVGNILGGNITDKLGANAASAIVILGIALTCLVMWIGSTSPVVMIVMVALLGLFSYAAVPALQARLIKVAESHSPDAQSVASGLNIAGFNSGIALGSVLGGITITEIGLEHVGLVGAVAALVGFIMVLMPLSTAQRENGLAKGIQS